MNDAKKRLNFLFFIKFAAKRKCEKNIIISFYPRMYKFAVRRKCEKCYFLNLLSENVNINSIQLNI